MISGHVEERAVVASILEKLIEGLDEPASHAGAHSLERRRYRCLRQLLYFGGERIAFLLLFIVVVAVVCVHDYYSFVRIVIVIYRRRRDVE
jgi:hypothetical protein